jgi:hypothetical protein
MRTAVLPFRLLRVMPYVCREALTLAPPSRLGVRASIEQLPEPDRK